MNAESPSRYAADCRSAVLQQLPEGHAMLLFGAHERLRNGDAEYRYRQESDLIYLTGWEDPDVAVLLRPDADAPFIMFVQKKDKEREIWTGIRAGTEGAVSEFGADEAFTWGELSEKLGELLIGYDTLHYRAGVDAARDQKVLGAIAGVARKARNEFKPVPDSFVNPGRILHEMRLIKRPEEIERMREAARITAEAHIGAMKLAAPGVREFELEALINYTFRKEGGTGPGYTSIVGSGENACILHYITNRDTIGEDELVLIDAGCEYDYYTADVTRTFPASGRFTEPQRELYELVLEAELACIAAATPGTTIGAIHDLAIEVLTTGLVRLGLLEGEVSKLIEDKDYKRFYMHGTSHWLGMDVHDVGTYIADDASRALQPGMVFTIEPGIYVSPDDEEAPERYRGIGIRIEDDILVTEGEADVLTGAIPKSIEDLEAICGG